MKGRDWVVPVAVALLLGACKGAEPGKDTASNPGAVPPDTSQVPKTPPGPAGGVVAAKEQHIQVANTLTMPMTVVAEVGGQTLALGIVEPKQEGSFMVQAPPGASFRIMANDSTNQHRVEAALMGGNGTVLHFVIR